MGDETAAASLLFLAVHPDSTTSEVAKAVFDPDDDDDLRNADRKVRYYFTEKFDHLVESDGDGTTTYRVTDESVEVGMGRMEMQSFNGDEISVGLGAVVMYPDENDDLNVAVVGEYEIHPW